MDYTDAAIHFSINGFTITAFQIIEILACIFIVSKYRKSIGAKLLLTGSILGFLGILGSRILPFLASFDDTDSVIKSQLITSYFNSFAFALFALGLILFATKDLKKNN